MLPCPLYDIIHYSFRLDYVLYPLLTFLHSYILRNTQTTNMPPTAPLAIATSSVQRLVKEEASYHRELEEQKKRVAKLESETGADDDGNREFLLKQEVRPVFSRIFSMVATGIEMNGFNTRISDERRMRPRLCCLH